jgi:hypothetical protein
VRQEGLTQAAVQERQLVGRWRRDKHLVRRLEVAPQAPALAQGRARGVRPAQRLFEAEELELLAGRLHQAILLPSTASWRDRCGRLR